MHLLRYVSPPSSYLTGSVPDHVVCRYCISHGSMYQTLNISGFTFSYFIFSFLMALCCVSPIITRYGPPLSLYRDVFVFHCPASLVEQASFIHSGCLDIFHYIVHYSPPTPMYLVSLSCFHCIVVSSVASCVIQVHSCVDLLLLNVSYSFSSTKSSSKV